jgi:hypothetical protein
VSKVVITPLEGRAGLPSRAHVEIDGVPVKHLRAFRIEHVAGKRPTLLLEIFPTEIWIDSNDAEVEQICFCPACKRSMPPVTRHEGNALEDVAPISPFGKVPE